MTDVASLIDASGLVKEGSAADWLASLHPKHVTISYPDGGFVIFDFSGAGLYEAHVLLQAKGAEALRQGKEACRRMFTEHGAHMLFGLTPVELRAARLYARRLGFQSFGVIETHEGPCEMFQMTEGQLR